MGKLLVLAVDRDKEQLIAIKNCLGKEKFKVRTAENRKEAMASMKKHPASILIVDEEIDEKGGIKLLSRIKRKYPEAIRCLICTNSNTERISEAINKREICSSLKKPWTNEQLIETVRNCVERFHIWEANMKSMQAILSAYQTGDRPRDEDLVLSTVILNVLSHGAVVVNDELQVIMTNDIYNFTIAAEQQSSDLPEELKTELRERMQIKWSEFRIPFDINGTEYWVRIRPLRMADSRTAILFFDQPGE